jgi:hypothetical protein
MRWAEGHSQNIKKMFWRLALSNKLTVAEKLELVYLAPYYLQAATFLLGTVCWFLSETVFKVTLPFWTSLWGWSLVISNLLALPLMNGVGIFLEEGEERDYVGLVSFIALSYLVVPFQAYAAIKGFIENKEGPWFRTPKTGRITDIYKRGRFYRWISEVLGERVWEPAIKINISRPSSRVARRIARVVVALAVIASSSLSYFASTVTLASTRSVRSQTLSLAGGGVKQEGADKELGMKVEIVNPERTPERFFVKDNQGEWRPYRLEQTGDGVEVVMKAKNGEQRYVFSRLTEEVKLRGDNGEKVVTWPEFEQKNAGQWQKLGRKGNVNLVVGGGRDVLELTQKYEIEAGQAEVNLKLGYSENEYINKWTFVLRPSDKSKTHRVKWVIQGDKGGAGGESDRGKGECRQNKKDGYCIRFGEFWHKGKNDSLYLKCTRD